MTRAAQLGAQRAWRVLLEGPVPAAEQMARDAALVRGPLPGVRVFQWEPAAVSLGFKQPRPGWLSGSSWRGGALEVVERPTGGGIAFHGTDVSIAIAAARHMSGRLDGLLAAVGRSTVALCESFGLAAEWDARRGSERIVYCLGEMSPYAVLVGGRKVAGFAVRRFPEGWLVEGSLLVRPLPQAVARALPPEALAPLHARATSLQEAAGTPIDEGVVARRWAQRWEAWWAGCW